MLEMMLNKYVPAIVIVLAAILGVFGKCIAGISLKRLVRASGNMNKSSHALVRLVKAKFEHACMVSDRVQNVGVFVEKYLYEYRVLGLRLHTWRRLEKGCAWLCLGAGLLGAGSWYQVYGMEDQVLQYAGAGAAAAVLLTVLRLMSDEAYQIEAAKNYMVDYLENFCARRLEKSREIREEWKEMAPPEENRAHTDKARIVEMKRRDAEAEAVRGREAAGQKAAGPETAVREEPEKAAARQERKPETAAGKEEADEQDIIRRLERQEDVIEEQVQKEEAEEPKGQEPEEKEAVILAARRRAAEQQESKAARHRGRKEGKEEEKPLSQEVRIREILEEFLA